MKRKIALLLALVMVLSMVPMMAFASTNNTKTIVVGGTPRLPDDHDSQEDYGFKADNSLRIEYDNAEVGSGKSFQLRIENAKWSKEAKRDKDIKAYPEGVTNGVYGHKAGSVDYTITSRTDKVLDIQLNNGIDVNEYFEIPLYFKTDGTGAVKITVDPMDSGITGGTFTVANAAKGDTVTTIDDIITFSEKGKLDPIRIEEITKGSLGKGDHTVKLRLPSNFEWVGKSADITVRGINGLSGKVSDKGTNDFDGERDIEITFNVSGESSTRGAVIIDGLEIFATNSAKEGDVEVRITSVKGDVTAETITVAKYSDFDITIKADGEAKELIAGRFEAWTKSGNRLEVGHANELDKDSLDDEAHELQTLIIEEEVGDALLGNRRTRIDFPSWVKVQGVKVDPTDAEVTLHGVGVNSKITNKTTEIFEHKYRGESYIELTIDPENKNDEAKVELTFFVSVKADAEGDIVAEVSGRSGAEGKVTLGKARRAVEMEIKGATPKVELGKKGQAIPEIIISEIEAEDIMDGSDLVVNLSNDAEWNDYKVEVIEGDLEIDHDNIDDDAGNLIIPIKKGDSSTKPSTIKISNATIDMKRMAADGDINVRVRGAAVRRNHLGESGEGRSAALDAGYFDQNDVVSAKVAELLHGNYREPGLVTQEVVLTIGSKTMFVDGVEETANAAPYIDSANRTMLPVSAIGRALGATVEWNDAARTVLVTKDNTRALLTIGKDVMNVNGMEIPMRSKAVISGERTFVPLKDLGVALGVNVEWDAATRTVTIK